MTFNAYLGDYVEDDTFGHRGRVYQVHPTGCPEGALWRSMQDRQLTDDEKAGKGRWVSILTVPAGSIVVPDRDVKVVGPFPMPNLWTDEYFRPDDEAGG